MQIFQPRSLLLNFVVYLNDQLKIFLFALISRTAPPREFQQQFKMNFAWQDTQAFEQSQRCLIHAAICTRTVVAKSTPAKFPVPLGLRQLERTPAMLTASSGL
jgi:hypothetical protein